jgi:hypothetical protein
MFSLYFKNKDHTVHASSKSRDSQLQANPDTAIRSGGSRSGTEHNRPLLSIHHRHSQTRGGHIKRTNNGKEQRHRLQRW